MHVININIYIVKKKINRYIYIYDTTFIYMLYNIFIIYQALKLIKCSVDQTILSQLIGLIGCSID
jgi:hypothetical protein